MNLVDKVVCYFDRLLGRSFGSDLEFYIIKRNPVDITDIERFTKEYEETLIRTRLR